MLWLRIVAALLVLSGPLLTVGSSQAQTAKKGQSGTGGAAGVTMEPPDMSRGMGAPRPDLEAQPSAPPAPMNAPPADEQEKDKAKPPPDDGAKTK